MDIENVIFLSNFKVANQLAISFQCPVESMQSWQSPGLPSNVSKFTARHTMLYNEPQILHSLQTVSESMAFNFVFLLYICAADMLGMTPGKFILSNW